MTFKRELQDQMSKEGDSVVFRCELSKPGAPIEWRKGRVVLTPGDKYEMIQEGKFTKLMIFNVEESDAGKYTCKSKDSESSAELTVKGKRGSVIQETSVTFIPFVLWTVYLSAYLTSFVFCRC